MAALDANDITVVIQRRAISGTTRVVRGTLAIAATDTYPTGGIPMPINAKFGMQRQLDILQITGSAGNTTEYIYRYDRANRKLAMYEEEAVAAGGPLLECDTSEAPGARTVNFLAMGW